MPPAARVSRMNRSRTDRVGGELRRQRLDRDEPVEPAIAREVDDAHAAAPDHFLDRVLRRDGFGEWA